jgi:outer membrane protein assembly factor BamB
MFAVLRPLVALALSLRLSGAAAAEDWPGWRGPRSDGTSAETDLPVRWSADENVRWKVSVPGIGHSSPIVSGNCIFLTSCREETKERILLCYDRRDGKLLWERVVLTAPLERKHQFNTYASSTPATDGTHVFVSFLAQSRAVVACYGTDGLKVWQTSPGEFHSVHGYCSAPVLYKDLVILNEDQDDPRAFIVALDKATGTERWRIARPGVRSYCPPTIVEAAGRTQMVLSGSSHVTSYDPATGAKLWEIDGPTEQFVASFVQQDGLLFMTGGFPERHVLAIRPDGRGDVTATHIAWRTTKGAGYVSSPVAWDHHVFLVSDEGIGTCWEARTGKQCWQERLGRRHHASPIVAEGRIYATDAEGTTYVLAAGPTFEVLAKNRFGEECSASPAVAGGNLFYRTAQHLWCIGK